MVARPTADFEYTVSRKPKRVASFGLGSDALGFKINLLTPVIGPLRLQPAFGGDMGSDRHLFAGIEHSRAVTVELSRSSIANAPANANAASVSATEDPGRVLKNQAAAVA